MNNTITSASRNSLKVNYLLCQAKVQLHANYNPSNTELPENSPRYVVLSYELKHKDGRTSFPLVLINWSPTTSETGMLTLHASALLNFQNTVSEESLYNCGMSDI